MTAIDYNLYCTHCAGDLRGAELSEACPHCHATIAETVNIAVLDADTHTVAVDVACVGCGYNLHTLRVDAKCPECGAGVLESIRPDDLCFADGKWLHEVRGGVTSLLLAIGALGLAFVGMFVLGYGFVGAFPQWLMVTVFICLNLFSLLAAVAGGMRVSTLDPHSRTPKSARVSGKLARLGIVVSLLGLVGNIVLILLAVVLAGSFMFTGLVLLFQAGIFFLGLSIAIALGFCFRHIANRGRRPGMRKATTILMWMIGSLGVLSILAVALSTIMITKAFSSPAGSNPYGTTMTVSNSNTNGAAMVSPKGAIPVTVTASPVVGPMGAPFSSTGLWAVLGCFLGAVYWVLAPACLILGIVLLFKYRTMLTQAITWADSYSAPRPSGGADHASQDAEGTY